MLPSTREFQSKDDAYCFSLAKALFCVSTPVTVGFYAPWGHCKDFLLTRIQYYMHLQSWKKDGQELRRTGLKQRGTSGWDLVSAVLLMIFYRPVLTLQHRQRRNVRHIFIRFSAWEYAGSDQLWAGLITALCDGIEGHFGLVPVSVYRAVGRNCGPVEAPLRTEWVSKRYLCLPLWAAVLLVGGAGIGVAVLVFLFGVPIGNASGDVIAVAEGLGATAVGITAAAALRMGVMVVRNVVITQKAQLERQMNRTDLSAQLGFMSNVKREVQTVTSFLRFMEVFQRRKLRVVLEVTSLDHCSPDRVVGVLDAMNILLSDNEAPFISILVADPSVLVGCVESSLYLKGVANNGHEFLNRLVTLPFSVPKADSETKLQLMRSIVSFREEQEKSLEEEEDGLGEGVRPEDPAGLFLRLRLCLCPRSRARSRAAEDGTVPLVVVSPGTAEPPKRGGKGFKAKDLIQEAFEFLLEEDTKLYLTDNLVQMRRVVNTVSVTIRLMATQVPREQLCPRRVASWVLLASQWPCRLSWILQCIEDDEQMGRLGLCRGGQLGPDLLLWDVYEKNLEEFVTLASQLEKLLALDGDPELFHGFLSGRLRVKDARFLQPYTVNMDASLKRHMELLRGSHGLRNIKGTPGHSRCLLLGMSVEEVCQELDKLGLKAENAQRYRERLRELKLDGRALAHSDRAELQEALGMGLGEWTAFSTHFLGSAPPWAPFPAAASPAPLSAGKPWQGPREKRLPGSRLSLALSEERLL